MLLFLSVLGDPAARAYSDLPNASQQIVSDGGRVLGGQSGGAGAQVRLHTVTAGAGKCLGMAPPARMGAPLVLWDCGTSTVQSFTQQDNGDGTWSYWVPGTTPGSRYCIDSIAGHHNNGTVIGFYPCSGANDQKWVVGPRSQLQAVDSPGKCMDERYSRTDNGTVMWLWDCGNDPGPIPAGVARLPAPGIATTKPPKPTAPATNPLPSATSVGPTSSAATASAAPAPSTAAGGSRTTPGVSSPSAVHPLPVGSEPSGASGSLTPVLIALCVLVLLWRMTAWRPSLSAWLTRLAPRRRPLRWRTDRLAPPVGAVTGRTSSVLTGSASPGPDVPSPLDPASNHSAEAGSVTSEDDAAPTPPTRAHGRWARLVSEFARSAARADSEASARQTGPDSSSASQPSAVPEVPVPASGENAPAEQAPVTSPTGHGTAISGSGAAPSSGVVLDTPEHRLDPTAMAPWWRPDPDLFTVFVQYDGLVSGFRFGGRVLTPLQFGELVRGQEDWQGRPLVLIAQGRIGGWAVQLLADQLQVPVVSGDQRGWWAMLPQRPDRGWTPVVRLAGSWPFPDADKARLRHSPDAGVQAQQVRSSVEAIEVDNQGLALLKRDQPGARQLLADFADWRRAAPAGLYGVAVQRSDTDPGCPYLVGDKPRSVWDVACELWRLREHWRASKALAVFTGISDTGQDSELRLLSTYLQTPVVAAPPAAPANPGGADTAQTVMTTAVSEAETPTAASSATAPEAACPPGDAATAASAGEGEPAGTLLAPDAMRTDHSSTLQERSVLRDALHRRYDTHARAIAQTLATNPGLRRAHSAPNDGSDIGDLVAVRVLVCGDRPVDPQGLPSSRVDAAWAACVASGLRRLPSYRGPVHYQGVPAGWRADTLVPGRTLRCPQVLRTSLHPPVGAQKRAVTVVWSLSGRRTGVLAVADTAEEAVFPGNSLFRVLEVRMDDAGSPSIVLLRELPAADGHRQTENTPTGVLDKDDLTVRALLLAWLNNDGPGKKAQ
ncbi:ricin-type beta-trefoil lectin domain protein [Kitasatospora sp. NPDC085879]|uniref:ricin-type beta-trefoil lectin domain protein n=1 Tax=Kitasatospora sp. NPDC085879 TaxID=3154769 RepID=UPI0034136851